MLDFFIENKREFVYSIFLFIILQMAQILFPLNIGKYYYFVAAMGLVLVVVWSLATYFAYAKMQLSMFSEVIVKRQIKDRLSLYFVWPLVFYSFLVLFLNESTDPVLRQIILVIGSITFFIFFLYVKGSYLKDYVMTNHTKAVFNFIDILIFFLGSSVIFYRGFEDPLEYLAVGILAFAMLAHQLYLHDQKSLFALGVIAVSMLFLNFVHYSIVYFGANVFISPLIMTIAFYTVLSLWNVRLAGHLHLDEYLTPILFSLMSFIVVLSL